VDDLPGSGSSLDQPPEVTGEGFHPNSMYTSRGNGFKGNILALHQFFFHAAFPADPEHRIGFIAQCLQDGECGVHAPAGPASADQQPHCKASLLKISLPVLPRDRH